MNLQKDSGVGMFLNRESQLKHGERQITQFLAYM